MAAHIFLFARIIWCLCSQPCHTHIHKPRHSETCSICVLIQLQCYTNIFQSRQKYPLTVYIILIPILAFFSFHLRSFDRYFFGIRKNALLKCFCVCVAYFFLLVSTCRLTKYLFLSLFKQMLSISNLFYRKLRSLLIILLHFCLFNFIIKEMRIRTTIFSSLRVLSNPLGEIKRVLYFSFAKKKTRNICVFFLARNGLKTF